MTARHGHARPSRAALTVLALVAVLAAACGASPAPPAPSSEAPTTSSAPAPAGTAPTTTPAPPTVPTPAHVVVLVLENKNPGEILGNPQAPYLNALAAGGAVFTDSHAVAHPSQPNYLALFAGSTFGVTSDACPIQVSGPNLATLLAASSRSFAGFSEGLPSAGFTGCSSDDYARKHAPWTDFPALPPAVGQPFNRFGPDYGALPTVSFVIPDLCHDMHSCPIGQGDAWIRQHLDGYVTWARAHDSLLVVTWDEADSDSGGNPILTLFVGPMVKPGRYGQRIDHYSVLRTIEDMYGLPPAGHSATAAPITGVWR